MNMHRRYLLIALLILAVVAPSVPLSVTAKTDYFANTSYELTLELFYNLIDDEDLINLYYTQIARAYPDPGNPGRLVEVAEFGRQLAGGLDDNYDKAKAIFAWIDANMKYDQELFNESQTLTDKYLAEGISYFSARIRARDDAKANLKRPSGGDMYYTAFANRLGLCQEYATLFRIMAVGAGVPTDYAHGHNHMWNIFWYDKESRWVLVDATWGIFDTSIEEFSKADHHLLTSTGFDTSTGVPYKPDFYNGSGMASPDEVMLPGPYYEISLSLYKGEQLRSISRRVFSDNVNLTSFVVPDGVTRIGEEAFARCSNLRTVVLPDGVTEIGEEAFMGCTSLESINIPDSVTWIGQGAFSGTRLSSLTIPPNLHEMCIPQGALRGTQITDVIIPDGFAQVSPLAFKDCSELVSIYLPSSITAIGAYAFEGCTSLADITIPSSVTHIGNSAFAGCAGMKSIIIPASVTFMGERVFPSSPDFTIIGQAGSFAEYYANVYNINFTTKGHEAKNIVMKIGSTEVMSGADTIEASPLAPQILSGRTMLPFRYLVQTVLGGEVDYDAASRRIIARVAHHDVVMEVDRLQIEVDGVLYEYGAAPTIVDGYTLVPLRAFEQVVSAIQWDADTQTVTIIP